MPNPFTREFKEEKRHVISYHNITYTSWTRSFIKILPTRCPFYCAELSKVSGILPFMGQALSV